MKQRLRGAKRLRMNPVLARELTARMRTHRAPIVLTGFLLALVGILKLIVDSVLRTTSVVQCVAGRCFGQANPAVVGSLGRPVLHFLLFCILVAVCFIVPGLTAGGVASERDRQTLVPLQVTLLSARSILVGKLLASLAFVALMLVASLPVLGASFWIGGVSIGDALAGVAMALATAVTLGALGLLCSTWIRRTQGAVVAAYGLMIVLTLGTVAVYGLQYLRRDATRCEGEMCVQGGAGVSTAPLLLNPFVATADALSGDGSFESTIGSPFTPMQMILVRDGSRNVRTPAVGVLRGMRVAAPAPAPRAQRFRVPFWMRSVASYAVVSFGAIWLASRRLAVPSEGHS